MKKTARETLRMLFRPYKGILAADARPASMDKRLREYGIPPGREKRDEYREMLFSTPNIERTISGIIVSEETFCEHETNGTPTRDFLQALGIAVGVKVDEGIQPFQERGKESKTLGVTVGLETLPKKCSEYKKKGADFLKWRAKIPVFGATGAFLSAIAEDMAKYARLALQKELVPVIEPEVLLEGAHDSDESAETMRKTLRAVTNALRAEKIGADTCVLKTSFAANGLERETLSADTVAKKTLRALKEAEIDKKNEFHGVVFLSGGLPSKTAIEYIQRIKAIAEQETTEYFFNKPITFSYARALQAPALQEWQGKKENALAAQIAFTQTAQHASKKYKGVEEAPTGGSGGEEK